MIEWKSLLNKNISLEKNIRNQSYWSALNIKDYSYNLRGGACFGGYNFSIKVQNNQVISITEISSREFDPERKHAKTENYDSNITLDDFIDKYQFNPSINQIFTVFGSILSNNPYHHIIEYDSILKYPKSAFFDFSNKNSLDFLVKPDNHFAESKTVDWKQGDWYHFAGSFAKGKMNIYINGQLEGEKKNATGIAPSDLDLWIGADDWKLPASSFPGVIDEVRIYNKALTEGEIKKLMTTPMLVSKTLNKLSITWSQLKIKH